MTLSAKEIIQSMIENTGEGPSTNGSFKDNGKLPLIVDKPEADRFFIHKDVYTDEKIFKKEMKKMYENNWVYLAHEQQLSNPGDFLARRIGRQPIILTRDENEELHAFYNRCRHRGVKVCRSDQGNTARFRCPYHFWTYKNSGELVGMPDQDGYPPDLNMEDFGLVEIANLASYKGFIFGSLREDVRPLKEYLGMARTYLDSIVDRHPGGIEVVPGEQSFVVNANWKIQLEGSAEFYHPPFTHASEGAGSMFRDYEYSPESPNKSVDLGSGHFGGLRELPPKSPDSLVRMLTEEKDRFGAPPDDGPPVLMHLAINPNVIILSSGMLIRRIEPINVDKTRVSFTYYFPSQADADIRKAFNTWRDDFWGGAANGSPDDSIMMHEAMDGYNAEDVPYNDYSKGIHREHEHSSVSDGLPPYRMAALNSDDAHYRGFYRWWRSWYEQAEQAEEQVDIA